MESTRDERELLITAGDVLGTASLWHTTQKVAENVAAQQAASKTRQAEASQSPTVMEFEDQPVLPELGTPQGFSIKWKLALIIVAVAVAVSVSQIVLFSLFDARSFKEYTRTRMQMLASIVGKNSTPALQFRDRDDAKEVLNSLGLERSIRSAYLMDGAGGVFAEYIRPGEVLSVPLISPKAAFERFDDENYVLFHRILLEDRLVGGLYLTSDLKDIKRRQRQAWVLGGAIGLAFFGISFLLALWLQRSFTRPILRLTATMRQITDKNDYSVRASKESSDEFGVLADGFNFMLREVERRDAELAKQMLLLERTNRELDQFVYIASHDLKAPLRAVDNLAQLIAKATKELLPPDKQEYLDLMHSRIKRMEHLFDDLLLYSRVGRVEAKVETVNVANLIRNIVDLAGAPESFTVKVPDALPTLRAERTPLEQVFRNLIGNALKHHDRKDGRIEIGAVDKGGHYEFSVCDDGPGIAPEYHEKIFQMFQTLRPRDQVEGSGMGLALVKKIVENQKGKVWLHSAEGEGTCFYFSWMKM